MDFALPQDLVAYLAELDDFIAAEIRPLEQKDDNIRFFDHRREWARTNFEDQGLPRREWEELRRDACRLADKAGHWRFSAPKKYGGKDGSNLWMAVIRDHFAAMGLGLHNDLQNEHSIVGNFPFVAMFEHFGTVEQQQEFILGGFAGTHRVAFGLTEPDHGSDATHMETRAVRETRDGVAGWRIDGRKMWITGMHVASHCAAFCRTSGKDGDAKGITCILVPASNPGMVVDEYMWTFNMPTDHPRMHFEDCWVPESAVLGPVDGGLSIAQSFVHQNRIRQAASSLGAAAFCVEEAVKYARRRKPFGQELARNQGIQFPAGRACYPVRDAARVHLQDRLGNGPDPAQGAGAPAVRQDFDVQLLRQPAGLRGGRPGDAGPRRDRLFAAHPVRAHLSPPPPLPHHRGRRRDPDAQGRRLPVRLSWTEESPVLIDQRI